MSLLNDDYQKRLFPFAYNILGSSDDAMDAIQDVITKYISSPKIEIGNEINYLIKAVINQSINIKKRNQRVLENSMWLPEPITTNTSDSNINRKEIISYTVMVLLEKLNPKERAVFILKEAFDYSHQEIADTLFFSIENSRKLLSRAKKLLAGIDKKSFPDYSVANEFLKNYIDVIRVGDVSALEKLLVEDITVKTDGGGKIAIVSELTIGIKATVDLILYVYKTYQKSFKIEIGMVNLQPALLFYRNGVLINCQVFEFEKNFSKVKGIYSIVDPSKLNFKN